MRVYQGGRLLWSEIEAANTIWKRLIGLIMTRKLQPQAGLLIWPCRQVHCFHMKYAIDVIFLSRGYEVISVQTMEPGQISKTYADSHYVLEVNAGQARLFDIRPGDNLLIEN